MLRKQATPFGRAGGKSNTAEVILQHFPPDIETYIEPFVGAGNIFFRMKQRPKRVILNDKDHRVAAVMLSLRDNAKKINNTIPRQHITEDEFNEYKSKHDGLSQLVAFRWSFFSNGVCYNKHKSPATIQTDFEPFGDKLKGAEIFSLDYSRIIELYDDENAFIYADPPYENCHQNFYECVSPILVLETLKRTKARWLLSYNDSPRIRELFREYNIKELPVTYKPLRNVGVRTVTELLISNYPLE